MSCCNYTSTLPFQEQQYYYQPTYWYYPQPYPSNQTMGYPMNTSLQSNEFDLPMFNNNVLQDDNFSIVTASDLCYTSPTAPPPPPNLTPYSTPSPQLSEVYSQPLDVYTQSTDSYFSMMDLFAPVEQTSTNNTVTNATTTTNSSVPATEKKHICPVCNHRSKRRHNLIEHMLTHNPNRPKTFKCSHCSRPFARKYDMKRHEKIHTR